MSEPLAKITGQDLVDAIEDGQTVVLDVRNPEEIQQYGTSEGSLKIPMDELDERQSELPTDRPILVA